MSGESELLDEAKELFRQGVDKSRKGEYAEAIQAFDQTLHLHSADADAYGHRCVARHRVGNKQSRDRGLSTSSNSLSSARKSKRASIRAENAAKAASVKIETAHSIKAF